MGLVKRVEGKCTVFVDGGNGVRDKTKRRKCVNNQSVNVMNAIITVSVFNGLEEGHVYSKIYKKLNVQPVGGLNRIEWNGRALLNTLDSG